MEELTAARRAARSGRAVVVATIVGGPGLAQRAVFDEAGEIVAGSLPDHIAGRAGEAATRALESDRSGTVAADDAELYLEVVAPPPRLVVLGAGPASESLVRMAAAAGFEVTVADPRPAFADPERFPDAVAVLVGWHDDLADGLVLDARTYVVSLLHDERFEGPMLPMVLDAPVRYIGALGSRRTHAARIERLTEAGYEDAADRIRGPVGLDIGSQTPTEIAVSILAEMIAVRRGALPA